MTDWSDFTDAMDALKTDMATFATNTSAAIARVNASLAGLTSNPAVQQATTELKALHDALETQNAAVQALDVPETPPAA